MSNTIQFDAYLRAAVKICERLGTWVVYEVRDADSLEELIGYMRYATKDLQRQHRRSKSIRRKDRYSELVGFWRRAVRWISSIDDEHARDLANLIIDELEHNPTYKTLPYVVPDSGHPSLTPKDKAPLPSTKPRAKRGRRKSLQTCARCEGLGLVEAV